MKLNDEIVVTILDDNHNGNGIAKYYDSASNTWKEVAATWG